MVSPSGTPHPGLAGNPAKTRALFSDDHTYFPKDCNYCAFYKPNIKSRLRSLFKAKAKDCYNCPFINGCIDRATKTRKEKKYFKNQTIIEKAVEWADTHLKEYTLDNNKKAYRLYLHDKEGNTVVINKDYINETFSKNKRNRKLAKTMSLATMVEEWMPLAKIVRTGDGIHHSCNFLVFEATYLDVTIEAKARDHGAYSILHTMRIKKLENPPERTANAADMSGLTNFSPQN